MKFRLSAAALAALATLAVAATAQANPADVTAGMLRTPLNRAGAPLRAEPKMGATILGQVPHAARLTVQSVENGWLKVTTEVTGAEGKKSSQTGWLRSVETVQPYALTGGSAAGAARGVASAENAAAAGRGFSEGSEKDLMTSDAAIAAAMPLVDKLEETVPNPHDVVKFANEGRLGMPGRTR